VATFDESEAYNSLLDYVTSEESRGISGSAIHAYVKSVRSWLAFNGVKVDRRIRVRGADQTPTLRDEEVPTPEGLRRILLAANSRQREAVALVAFSGLRLEVIGNYRGTDGLTIQDLPELKIERGKASFTSLPARVLVRPGLSKTGRAYFSWIGSEGGGYILASLEGRMQDGEKLTKDSAIFAPRASSSAKHFIKTSRVSMFMRQAIERAGFDFRPYNLRCYFDTQLLLAESKGRVAHDYRVFWMGHSGSIENRYTTNKGRLPRELVLDMAQAYGRAETFLSTIPTADEKAEKTAQMKASALELVGYSAEEAERLVADPKADLKKLFREKLGASSASTVEAATATGQQKVIDAETAQQYIDAGWTVKTGLNGTKALIEWDHPTPK